MAWYKEGTVSVTNGSTTVTGTGTNFPAFVRTGDGFRGPDGGWYEIQNFASATVFSIYPPYAGATAGAAPYLIAPLQGYPKLAADRLWEITRNMASAALKVAGVSPGIDGDVPGLGLSTALSSWLVVKEAGKVLSSNDFTNELKTKLDGIATGATANSSDATLVNRANHTGTQLAATISNFAAAVRDTVLTGIVFTQIAAVLATDSFLVAIGKLQAQTTLGGWGLGTSKGISADLNVVSASQQFNINAASTLNIPWQRGSTTVPFAAGSTGIVSCWQQPSTGHWQMLVFDRVSNSIAYRRMNGGAVQSDDYLVLYPTGKNFLDINQGGTGGATQADARTALGLVPVSNLTDVTAGRLATVGWMGLGSTATPYLADLNNLTGTRMFSFGTGQTANMVAGMDYGQGLFMNGPSGTDGSMLLLNHDSNRAFMKNKRANVYSPGFEFHTTANSQLDPALGTGGLMSYGTNANGEYWKFANGLLICKIVRNITAAVTTNAAGIYYTNTDTWTFPVPFIVNAPLVNSSHVSSGVLTWELGNLPGLTSTSPAIGAMQSIASRSFVQSLLAIGRWK